MTTTPTTVPDAPPIAGLAFRAATADDWPMLADVLNRARAVDGVDEVQTGESLANDQGSVDGFDVRRDVLVGEIDGEPVAFGVGSRVIREDRLTLETWGAVLPEHRRRGIGTALHRASRARLVAEAASDPHPGPRWFGAFALEIEHGDIALLEAEGFVRIRFGFEMRRRVTGRLPEIALPAGIEMRPVATDQVRTILEADNEAFRDHWGHREATESVYRAWLEGPDTDPSLWCVGWDGDEVAGVVINTIYASENEQLGIRRAWLDHVSVRRPWRGRGVAKALCAASLRVLQERGMEEAWLGVDGSNPTGAVRLYEGLGFTVVRRWYAFGRPIDRPAPAGWQPGDAPA